MHPRQEKGKVSSGGQGAGASSSLLMDPFLSAHANDEELEGMLDRFKVTIWFRFIYSSPCIGFLCVCVGGGGG